MFLSWGGKGEYSSITNTEETNRQGVRLPSVTHPKTLHPPSPYKKTPKAEEFVFYLAIFLFNGAEGAEDFFEICAGGAKQNTETPKLRKIRIIKFRNSRP